MRRGVHFTAHTWAVACWHPEEQAGQAHTQKSEMEKDPKSFRAVEQRSTESTGRLFFSLKARGEKVCIPALGKVELGLVF